MASSRKSFVVCVRESIGYIKRVCKKRPTCENISRSLRMQHHFPNVIEKDIEKQLDAAVSRGELNVVVSDGCKIYLDPSSGTAVRSRVRAQKVQQAKKCAASTTSPSSGHCVTISKLTSAVISAVLRLTVAGNVATVKSICDYLMNEHARFRSNSELMQHVRICCNRAVTMGHLQKKPEKRYSVTDYGRRVVVAFQNRQLKKTLPKLMLDEALAKKEPATPISICSFCFGTDEQNRKGIAEMMLCCVDCGRCGHPSCLQFGPELTAAVKKSIWQCIECKMCSICASAGEEKNMLFCDSCDRGFHMDCCQPPMQRKPKGNWECCVCEHAHFTKHLDSFCNQANALVKADVKSSSSELSSQWDPDALPPDVSKEDEELFVRVQKMVTGEQNAEGASTEQVSVTSQRCPSSIEIGKYLVNTWYSSPYPQIYAKLPVLYICENCLTYVDSHTVLQNHLGRCHVLKPPGNEIYRSGSLSVHEVDGNVSKIYCQNMCLLAKLFLDHKTLYYDVEPFVFYVLTLSDDEGSHFVGYFSKEKYNIHKYNLSCIMTLPQYQRRGFGRFLIDFSYLLSRVEGVSGAPEKPLSDLGQISYESYWKDVILTQLEKLSGQSVSIQGLSECTGICVPDIISTLQSLELIARLDDDRYSLVLDHELLETRRRSRKAGVITIDESLLQWSPLVSQSMVENEEKQAEMELQNVSLLTDEIVDERQQRKKSVGTKTSVKAKRAQRMSPLRSNSFNVKCNKRSSGRAAEESKNSKRSRKMDGRINGVEFYTSPIKCSTPKRSKSCQFESKQKARQFGQSSSPRLSATGVKNSRHSPRGRTRNRGNPYYGGFMESSAISIQNQMTSNVKRRASTMSYHVQKSRHSAAAVRRHTVTNSKSLQHSSSASRAPIRNNALSFFQCSRRRYRNVQATRRQSLPSKSNQQRSVHIRKRRRSSVLGRRTPQSAVASSEALVSKRSASVGRSSSSSFSCFSKRGRSSRPYASRGRRRQQRQLLPSTMIQSAAVYQDPLSLQETVLTDDTSQLCVESATAHQSQHSPGYSKDCVEHDAVFSETLSGNSSPSQPGLMQQRRGRKRKSADYSLTMNVAAETASDSKNDVHSKVKTRSSRVSVSSAEVVRCNVPANDLARTRRSVVRIARLSSAALSIDTKPQLDEDGHKDSASVTTATTDYSIRHAGREHDCFDESSQACSDTDSEKTVQFFVDEQLIGIGFDDSLAAVDDEASADLQLPVAIDGCQPETICRDGDAADVPAKSRINQLTAGVCLDVDRHAVYNDLKLLDGDKVDSSCSEKSALHLQQTPEQRGFSAAHLKVVESCVKSVESPVSSKAKSLASVYNFQSSEVTDAVKDCQLCIVPSHSVLDERQMPSHSLGSLVLQQTPNGAIEMPSVSFTAVR